MGYREEFPDYPVDSLPAIPEAWNDMSWANDACPCFGIGDLIVFIDFPNPSDREFPETPRFTVQANPEVHDHNDALLSTDDWDAVLAFVRARKVEA